MKKRENNHCRRSESINSWLEVPKQLEGYQEKHKEKCSMMRMMIIMGKTTSFLWKFFDGNAILWRLSRYIPRLAIIYFKRLLFFHNFLRYLEQRHDERWLLHSLLSFEYFIKLKVLSLEKMIKWRAYWKCLLFFNSW